MKKMGEKGKEAEKNKQEIGTNKEINKVDYGKNM